MNGAAAPCAHLDGNLCTKCLGDRCFVCLGSGVVDYYDSPIPCGECRGTGKIAAPSARHSESA